MPPHTEVKGKRKMERREGEERDRKGQGKDNKGRVREGNRGR